MWLATDNGMMVFLRICEFLCFQTSFFYFDLCFFEDKQK